MNVRPFRDRVLVKRIEAQEQRIGGIIVPDTAKDKPQQAVRADMAGKQIVAGIVSDLLISSDDLWRSSRGWRVSRSTSRTRLGVVSRR